MKDNKKIMYIAYCGRSSVSGRLLFDYLRSSELSEDFSVRRTNKLKPKKIADIVLRYGSSKDISISDDGFEINSLESVENAANKLRMAEILSSTDGVNFPAFIPLYAMDDIPFDQMYVRDRNQKVRFVDLNNGGSVRGDDLYLLAPIDKSNEYRIHIFNNKTIGVYEKIPHNQEDKLRKQDNCNFVRLNMADESVSSSLIGARPMARMATEAMGLVYGGVDIMRSSDGQWWVNEVNSSPGLNSLNVERVGNLVIDYVRQKVSV